MQNRKKIFRLKGVVQHYAWGGDQFIPALLQEQNKTAKPYAEYWMGAHDNAPAEIYLDEHQKEKLNSIILDDPELVLGKKVSLEFGRMPYLLKILDVKDMLSIQVHPDKKSAENAFQQENDKGIALTAPDRNYKDPNHKPELMVALSDFWLLHGFKPKAELLAVLNDVPELNFLEKIFETNGYQALYRKVMEMSQEEVNRSLQPLLNRITPLYKNDQLNKEQEDFWAARAAMTFTEGDNIDRGIFSIYFFNLVGCHEGDAVFQDAGVPHAYLEGQNVEIMANSDNVLRGGLTPKHVDVQELLKYIKFEGIHPKIIIPKKRNETEEIYETPAPDFELSRFSLDKNQNASFTASTADIIFIHVGEITLVDGQDQLILKAGEAALILAGTHAHISAALTSSFYRASVPMHGE